MLALSLHLAIVTGFTLRILLRDELAPTTRLAWFMVIVVLPVFGSVIYFLFGEVNLGRTQTDRISEVSREFRAHRDLVLRVQQIDHRDAIAVAARGQDGRLVDQVFQVGAGKAGRLLGDHVQVDVGGQRLAAHVHVKDGAAAAHVGRVHGDAPVEAARQH